jgi:hypothetical protein
MPDWEDVEQLQSNIAMQSKSVTAKVPDTYYNDGISYFACDVIGRLNS